MTRSSLSRSADAPNLVVVFPDEMRPHAMGFVGADPVITPNLDRFARESLFLPNAASCYPVCSPYRACLLTGKYPYGHGVFLNCNSWGTRFGAYLRPHERCLSDILKDAGYSCGYIGKWHLDAPDAPPSETWEKAVWDTYTPPGPRRHGFDFWHAYGCENRHLNPGYDIGDAPQRVRFDRWSPEVEAEAACGFLRNEGGGRRDPAKPFALLVSMNPPHMPFSAVPERYKAAYGPRTSRSLLTRPNVRFEGEGKRAEADARDYFAAVTGVDDQFGRILDCLAETGLDRDTIVVFTSDHGEMMGSHGLMFKSVWYDESFLVPFLIRFPGRIAPGRDSLPLNVPDLMPTLLGLMGWSDRLPAGVEGSDHSAVLLGRSQARPMSAFYLLPDPYRPMGGARGVRTDTHTFVIDRRAGGQRLVLHDNKADPCQMHDIAGREPALSEALTAELDRWLERTRDPWGRTSFAPR